MDGTQSVEIGQFAGFIGPENLLSLVRNTAPYIFRRGWIDTPDSGSTPLWELADSPVGYLSIVRAGKNLDATPTPDAGQRTAYFCLCLASHMSTVATFIPTDVDTKIRGALWFADDDPEALARMRSVTLAARGWNMSPVSTRMVSIDHADTAGDKNSEHAIGGHCINGHHISGHDGEWLGVACAALGRCLSLGDTLNTDVFAHAIEQELTREADAFNTIRHRHDGELDLLRLSAILTHNAGDVDQALSQWPSALHGHRLYARFARLAHENIHIFSGAFDTAAQIYKRLMSAEGHRHYPLRAVKCLRAWPELLLPIGPFFDAWGAAIGTHPDVKDSERAEVADALVAGCRKIAGQQGYFRALAGLEDALGGFDRLYKYMPAAQAKALKDSGVRRSIAIKCISFESAMKKKTQALLAELGR